VKSLREEQKKRLIEIVGAENFSTGQSNLELHLHDISPHTGVLPSGVIWPTTTEEVANILKFTYHENIPVTPWGAGTSTEGNPLPTAGGLVINLTRMNRILAIREDDLQVDVQPGVLRKELKRKFMRLEHGESYDIMKKIKNMLDPKDLMNPGKIFI